ncbi:MAG: hypothetical protein R3F61_01515 [Myxococcota bacterium]
MRSVVLVGVSLGLLGLAGCRTCTLLYVPSSLVVVVEAVDPEPGRYAVEVSAIPFGGAAVAMCVVDLPSPEPRAVCTQSAGMTVGGGGFTLQTLGLVPEELTVTISRDGEVLNEQDFEPSYSTSHPNGEGCGTTRRGTVSLTL